MRANSTFTDLSPNAIYALKIIYELDKYTTYKAEEAGKYVYFVSPNGTSQICSKCGVIVKCIAQHSQEGRVGHTQT